MHAWNERNLEKVLWRKARDRAAKLGIPFRISVEDVKVPTRCPILGIPLKMNRGKHAATSPTLDRIIPKKGYVRGNTAVISFRANLIKNDATPQELDLVARWVRRHTSGASSDTD